MPRKRVITGGKKDEILQAAQELIFEKGYESTSIREIMKQADGEIGLFYYYFKNKEEVYEQILGSLFMKYHNMMYEAVEWGRRDPCRVFSVFFERVQEEVKLFREQYAKSMHRTVRLAIREHILLMMVPQIRRVLDILVEHGAQPEAELEVAANFITHGVGNIIVFGDFEKARRLHGEFQNCVHLLLGLRGDTKQLLFPYKATPDEFSQVEALLLSVQEAFPEPEYVKTCLVRCYERQEVLVIRYNGSVVGCAGYDSQARKLLFLATDKAFRGKKIAGRLIASALAQFAVGETIAVSVWSEEQQNYFEYRGFVRGERVENGAVQTLYQVTTTECVIKKALQME